MQSKYVEHIIPQKKAASMLRPHSVICSLVAVSVMVGAGTSSARALPTIVGTAGNDTITAADGNPALIKALGGQDLIFSNGAFADAGGGNDAVVLPSPITYKHINCGSGNDVVWQSGGSPTTNCEHEYGIFSGGAFGNYATSPVPPTFYGSRIIQGSDVDSTLTATLVIGSRGFNSPVPLPTALLAGNGNNTLLGADRTPGSTAQLIVGGLGNDTIDTGADGAEVPQSMPQSIAVVDSGDGDDVIIVRGSGDIVDCGAGQDRVYTSFPESAGHYTNCETVIAV